jgi:hypothetical protein
MPSDLTGTVTHSHDPKPPELPPLPDAIVLFIYADRPASKEWGATAHVTAKGAERHVAELDASNYATRIVTIQPPPSARGVTDACCGTGLCDPAAELAQLRLDCKALAAEVRLRRAVPESSPGEIWEAMEAVDASGALTRHTGDGT